MSLSTENVNQPSQQCIAINISNNVRCKKSAKHGELCTIHYKQSQAKQIKTIHNNTDLTEKPVKKIKIKKSMTRERFLKTLNKYIDHLDGIVKIQSIFRGFLVRKMIRLRGISVYCRHLVNNETDFLTFDSIENISNESYYSFKDNDNIVWGFNIITFKELLKEAENGSVTNPYTTKIIDSDTIEKFKSLISKIEKHRKVEVEKTVIEDPFICMQQKCIKVFQKMDNLEQYTQCEWFTELSLGELRELYKQMLDLWDYRVGLTDIDKRKYVKSGKLFTESVSNINNCKDKLKLSNVLLDDFDRLVSEGKTRADKTTGALWILSGLTLVSLSARDALPWLFQSAAL